MFQITNLLLLMMVTLFVLPASAFMYASGSTENNDDGSSDSGSTENNDDGSSDSGSTENNDDGSSDSGSTENNDDGSSDSGSTSSNSAETVQQQSADFENTILNIHNQERANVQVPTLTWSNSLATDAQGYANELASMGLGPDDIPPHSGDQSQGENLSWGSSNGYSLETSVQQWAGEKSNYEAWSRDE